MRSFDAAAGAMAQAVYHDGRGGRMGKMSLYDQDVYAWANEQAALLRAGKLT